MKLEERIGGYFLPLEDNLMDFKSANALKSSVLLMFFVLFGLMIFTEITSVIVRGHPSALSLISKDGDFSKAVFLFSPSILLVIWLFLPPTQVTLDRLGGAVHYRQGKRRYDFPWGQISFKHQWIPTKTGGTTLFTLVALPPFPEELQRLIEKKARPAPGQAYTFQLGSFDVKGPEHGQAIHAFLDTWMRSREPAANLYQAMVQSRLST
jgi:hypothetical protein